MIEYNVYSSYVEESTPWSSWSDEDIFDWAVKRHHKDFVYRTMTFPLMNVNMYGPNIVEVNTNGEVQRLREEY